MRRLCLLSALLGCSVSAVVAAPVIYSVTVDTASLAGTTGSLDFNFDPGPLGSQSAYAQVLNFTSDGSVLGSPAVAGDATGSLPGTLTLRNRTDFNDYFEQFTYGSTLSFNVSLYGLALLIPNGTSGSGSTFAFSMFSDNAGTVPALTSDVADGFAYVVNVNLDGSTTVIDTIEDSTATPDPPTLLLVGIALLLPMFSARSLKNLGR